MKRHTTLLMCALALAASGRADDAINPERPGFTNGVATAGSRVWQWEEGATRRGGAWQVGDGGILRYGVVPRAELRLGLPTWQRPAGFSRASAGIKVGLGPHFAWIAQRTAGRSGAGQAALEAEFALAPTITLQADALRDARWSSGINLGIALTPRLSAFVEGYRAGGWHGDGGLVFPWGADRQIDLSAGDHFVSFGYSWRGRG